MFVVIGFMFAGLFAGYLLRNRQMKFTNKIVTLLIWILLFLLGLEVGGNSDIISGLHTIGIEAVVITVAAVLGSVTGALLLWNWISKQKKKELNNER